MVAKKKTKTRTKRWVEPDWDPWYIKMLDAVGEYIDGIGHRDDTEIDSRDIMIIKALIDFYGFDNDEMHDILDDVNVREEQLHRQSKKGKDH
jgi:hypothetical protein